MSPPTPSNLSVLLDPLKTVLALTPLGRFLPRVDHFAPHPEAPFEGYYVRVLTEGNDTILCIFSTVHTASTKPHYLHFSHIPCGPTGVSKALEINTFPSKTTEILGERLPDGTQEFLRIASMASGREVGRIEVCGDFQRVLLCLDDVEVEIKLDKRVPWGTGSSVDGGLLRTPEGVFSGLGGWLPLHWNVFSLRSRAEYCVRRSGEEVVAQGVGVAHLEKNWGVEFPSGWVWVQAFSNTQKTTFSLAGGKILRSKAYLLTYRSPTLSWDFSPLWTLMPFAANTPFITEGHDSLAGTFSLRVQDFWRKLVITVRGPPNHKNYIPLSAPLSQGHSNKIAWETFEAVVVVRAYRRDSSWSAIAGNSWAFVEESRILNAALEFGGDYSFMQGREL